MATKFPKRAISKWTRFSKFEQIFIVYCFVLLAWFIFAPFLQQVNLNETVSNFFSRQTPSMLTSNILILVLIVLLIFWNTSFRFKRVINVLVWFKENDALINFMILFLISIYFVVYKDLISLVKEHLSDTFRLTSYFYAMYILIILWLVYNLFLATKISSSKKKPQIVNITQEKEQQEADERLKTLFE